MWFRISKSSLILQDLCRLGNFLTCDAMLLDFELISVKSDDHSKFFDYPCISTVISVK